MEEIVSPPAASALMESTRSIGYSFETALADLIDNSISAHSSKIWVKSIPSDDPFVTILDDGDGLSLEQLEQAMRYGTNPNAIRNFDDLGRFGLGMKMASLSQCRRLTVVSKTNTSRELAICRWDLDRVIETDQWTLQILSECDIKNLPQIEKLSELDKGTLVVWENLDKIRERSTSIKDTMTEIIPIAKKHLALTFHRFMEDRNKPLVILFNDEELVPLDPFLSTNPLTKKEPGDTIQINGYKIEIQPFVLPPESKLTHEDVEKLGGLERRMQGFWIYRNKRLIIPGTWFRMGKSRELTKLARVRVDIPNTLDSVWDIDVKKSSAFVPAQFRKMFSSIIDKLSQSSERKYTYRGRKVNDNNIEFIWDRISFNGSFSYKVNLDHPLIKQCLDSMGEDSSDTLISLIKIIEDSVPFDDIYNQMMEAKLGRPEFTDKEKEKLINIGIRLIDGGADPSRFSSIEPFIGHQDVLDYLEKYARGE